MDASHYHATVLTQMHRILRGIDDIPEMSAIVLQYSKIDGPTNATITELFADIQQHAPAHHVALAQADSVCAVCDHAGHNATNCRMLCAAKDEPFVEFMGRIFCCNFLRKS
jgi:hypothetical protein